MGLTPWGLLSGTRRQEAKQSAASLTFSMWEGPSDKWGHVG